MMNGPYYGGVRGGGGYDGGVQMVQPHQGGYGNDEGNYVNGGFDQGVAEANQAFPLGTFAPYLGESLQDAVSRAFGKQRGEDGRTSGHHSQTDRGASSGQQYTHGGDGRGKEKQGETQQGERKRQGTRDGYTGLYTAADHSEL